ETSIKVVIRNAWASAPRSCPWAGFAAAPTARSTTICFQALSLNVPNAWAIRRPRRGLSGLPSPFLTDLALVIAREPHRSGKSGAGRRSRCGESLQPWYTIRNAPSNTLSTEACQAEVPRQQSSAVSPARSVRRGQRAQRGEGDGADAELVLVRAQRHQ